MNTKEITNKNNAMVHKAILYSLPSIVPPISAAIALVKLTVGSNKDLGKAFILPITIATAKASPKARAKPSTTPAKMPCFATGKTIL